MVAGLFAWFVSFWLAARSRASSCALPAQKAAALAGFLAALRLLPDLRIRRARAAHALHGRRGGGGAVAGMADQRFARARRRAARGARARSLGGAVAGLLAVVRRGRGDLLRRQRACRRPHWLAQWGAGAMGGDRGPRAAAAGAVPAGVAGVAARQRGRDSAGEPGDHAARARGRGAAASTGSSSSRTR